MIFDSHMHTRYSADSQMILKDALKTAQMKYIGIITTEHLDLNLGEKWRFDIREYLSEYKGYKSEGNLLTGIEMGMDTRYAIENRSIATNHNFDFILGSVHSIKDLDLFPKETYAQFLTREDFYKTYFRYMFECISSHDFIDSLAHIDYPARYAPYENKTVYFEDFKDEISKVFELLLKKNIVLEFNLRRFREDTLDQFESLYSNYKKLGGRYVTLGSDAHRTDDIAYNIDIAVPFIEKLGLEIVHFENGMMVSRAKPK